MIFFIQFTDRRKKLARIQAGSFSESFCVHSSLSTTALEEVWLRELAALLGTKKKVALPIEGDSRSLAHGWVFYRHEGSAFIQDRLFPEGFDPATSRIPQRETVTEEGDKVSEWSVPLSDIAEFLRRRASLGGAPKTPRRPASKPSRPTGGARS